MEKRTKLNEMKGILRESQVLKREKVLQQFNENTINPFVNRTQTNGPYEWFKIIILGTILLPIRFTILLFLLFLTWLISVFVLLGLDKKDIAKKPLSKTRRLLLTPVPYLFRAALFLLGYHWISVKGKPDSSARVIVMNHLSFFEALFILYSCFPHMVAKKETTNIPVIGSLFQTFQPILVDRSVGGKDSRKMTIDQINERAKNECGEWNRIAIFPEGTVTNGSCLITFKAGAFYPGEPVQPVIFRLPFINFDPHYVLGLSGLRLFFQSMCQFTNYMSVEYLPVYHPNDEEKQNPNLYANNVRKTMAKALNIPISSHSYEDVILQMEAYNRNMNLNDVNIESSLFRSLLSSNQVSNDDIISLLNQFSKMDVNNTGKITFDQFRVALKLPDNPATRMIFNMMDVDEGGSIDFREFITGKALIATNLTNEESLNIAFESFDLNKDGFVDYKELSSTLLHAFPNMDEMEIESLFSSIQKENDERISREEFNNHMKKYPEYMGVLLSYKNGNSEEKKDQ